MTYLPGDIVMWTGPDYLASRYTHIGGLFSIIEGRDSPYLCTSLCACVACTYMARSYWLGGNHLQLVYRPKQGLDDLFRSGLGRH
jgi:hypothetical protein